MGWIALAAAASSVICVAAGCGGDLEGRVAVVGSTTVLPFASSVAGPFAAANPLVNVSLRMDGTASGMTVFCDGTAQIAAASRPINDNEILACKASHVHYVQLMIAKDAIVAFTGPKNTKVSCLSIPDLYALTSSEATGGGTWRAATPVAAALGSDTTLPARRLLVVTPNAASGTRQLFLEKVIAPIAARRHRPDDLRVDHKTVAREFEMLAEADAAPGLLGIAGYATVQPWGDKVRTLEVKTGDQCVAPTAADIASGAYPLSRPLYLYVSLDAAQQSDAVRALVDALVSPDALASGGEGAAVPLTPAAVEATADAWTRALEGDPSAGT
jgi:phosphate transport system substrate-binding protein